MKKKIIYILISTLMLLFSPIIIKAAYWGGSIVGGTALGGGECPTGYPGYFCAYNNMHHKTIAVKLAYIDNGNIQQIGKQIFITNNTHGISGIGIPVVDGGDIYYYTTINTWCSANGNALTSDLYNDSMLKSYFNSDKDNFAAFISCLGVDIKSLTKSSDTAPGSKGYRLIVEPAKTGKIDGKAYLMTVKAIANKYHTGAYYFTTSGSSKYHLNIYQTIDDVGINKANTSYSSTTGTKPDYTISAHDSGYGQALVDIGGFVEPETCPIKKSKLTTNSDAALKLQNDTIWEILNNKNPSATDKSCYTCEDYILYYFTDYTQKYARTNNPYFSGNLEDAKSQIAKIKATGYVNWSSSNCKNDIKTDTCASYKSSHPAATIDEMKAANVTWPGCYSCVIGSANYDSRYDTLLREEDRPAECKTPDIPDLCNFELDVSISNNCLTTTKSHIYDINDWHCIFTSQTSGETHIQDHFYQEEMSSNRFCDIYCREEVDYQYANNSMIVLAGQRFTIGNQFSSFPVLKPVKFTAKTTCRTTSDSKEGEIDLDEFKEVYNDADDVVNTKWDEYQQAKVDRMAAQAATSSAGGSGTCKDKKGNVTGSWSTTKYSGTATNGVYKGSVSWSHTTGCKSSGSSKTSKISSMQSAESTALTAYNNAVTARTDVIKELHQCNTFQYTNRKFSPNLYFKYEEEMYGGDVYNLNKSVSISSSSKYYTGGTAESATGTKRGSASWTTSSYKSASQDIITVTSLSSLKGSTTTIAKNKCEDGKKCVKTATDTYENNNWVEQTTTKTYNYTLPAGVYEYITKPSGLSVNTLAEAQAESTTYYHLGASNLPVHYSRQEGRYDFEIDYDTFGKSGSLEHKFDKFIFDGAMYGDIYGKYYDVYYLMLTKPNLSSLLGHCNAADHLGHGMAQQLNNEGLLDDFLNSSCAKQHNCYSDYSKYNVTCTRFNNDVTTDGYGKLSGYGSGWQTYRPGSRTRPSYKTYAQLINCIQSYSISEVERTFDSDTTYKCTYKVENELFPPTTNYKDLNVIYRPISLNNPFPGQSGTTRTPGSNWNWRSAISTYITNNRDTETEDMYKELDPLYKITLTPAVIQEIRKYNDARDSQSVTFYIGKSEKITGNAGYSDFNLECINGRYCLSKFIRNSVTVGGRTYDFSRYFSGCGIDDTGLRCNTDEEW